MFRATSCQRCVSGLAWGCTSTQGRAEEAQRGLGSSLSGAYNEFFLAPEVAEQKLTTEKVPSSSTPPHPSPWCPHPSPGLPHPSPDLPHPFPRPPAPPPRGAHTSSREPGGERGEDQPSVRTMGSSGGPPSAAPGSGGAAGLGSIHLVGASRKVTGSPSLHFSVDPRTPRVCKALVKHTHY